jgi:trehalose 6-phosphate phosphatase
VIPDVLAEAVRALAARPRLLVALDFDGVIAPIVERPEDARPLDGSMSAVRRLATLHGVQVALVSGRALDSLRAAAGVSSEDDLSLVGSHGTETALRAELRGRGDGSGPAAALGPAERELLARVVDALRSIAGAGQDLRGPDGLEVETKPTGAVLHTRRASPPVAERATEEALRGPGSWPGVHVTRGKSVVEMAVVETSKGAALQRLRALTDSDGTLYVGDDVTDESAFEVLGDRDVAVKVGPGETHAAYRLDRPEDVLELLQLLVAERAQR